KEFQNEESDKGHYTRREFSYAAFKRSFDLPDTVDSSKIAANYKDGILHLVIPKKEEAKPQPIRKIQVG
ncbi:MAG TPA: Hsp20/alpha crystallin family protein, partial [Phaeodactylibacter sp.]|nr:Hsp20/alpha crystallin family protein [Phaeodactylibacter sp.]